MGHLGLVGEDLCAVGWPIETTKVFIKPLLLGSVPQCDSGEAMIVTLEPAVHMLAFC